ncbi:hypothetical protein CR513_49020, partial [Mucuna pruriens]
MERIMLFENSLPKHLWSEAINISCYVQKIMLIRLMLDKTPYKLWRGKRHIISYFHLFGCECFIVNTMVSFLEIQIRLRHIELKSKDQIIFQKSIFLCIRVRD